MLFTLPTSIPEQERPLLKQQAIASGHWHNVKIICARATHHNSLHTFLDAYFVLVMPGNHVERPDGWQYSEYIELRGSWSVIVQPVSLEGQ